ncbi:MAG: HlyD family efflux transporter periplasmic adaptor subunit [Bacteroidales bacterium]|jgi:HlyD family secretion protein|nr:HlyD family efflux transporter periplasmic adaptor subunit [Bacteroidales bacterium]
MNKMSKMQKPQKQIFQNAVIRWFNPCFTIAIVVGLSACYSTDREADAYGNFEAVEIIVSAEENGKILSLALREGDVLEQNQPVGLIDTALIVLNRLQLVASLNVTNVELQQIDKNVAVQQKQVAYLQREMERAQQLLAGNATTQQSFDRIESELDIARAQVEQILAPKAQIFAQQKVVQAQIAVADEQLRRCTVRAPQAGTVLQKYAEAGEFTTAGKPLFKLADTGTATLRAYISGAQLAQVKIGQKVCVRIDKGTRAYQNFEGVVAHVAATAEFTPKIIQTREERVDLVYAVKIHVINDGSIKIGMPGEVIFQQDGQGQ